MLGLLLCYHMLGHYLAIAGMTHTVPGTFALGFTKEFLLTGQLFAMKATSTLLCYHFQTLLDK